MSRQSSQAIKSLEAEIDLLPERDKFRVRATLQTITQSMNSMPPAASGLLLEYILAVIIDVKEIRQSS